jgi:hypothetical protein
MTLYCNRKEGERRRKEEKKEREKKNTCQSVGSLIGVFKSSSSSEDVTPCRPDPRRSLDRQTGSCRYPKVSGPPSH